MPGPRWLMIGWVSAARTSGATSTGPGRKKRPRGAGLDNPSLEHVARAHEGNTAVVPVPEQRLARGGVDRPGGVGHHVEAAGGPVAQQSLDGEAVADVERHAV